MSLSLTKGSTLTETSGRKTSLAAEWDKDTVMLKTWYRSIRTWYTRLELTKSGDCASELTE